MNAPSTFEWAPLATFEWPALTPIGMFEPVPEAPLVQTVVDCRPIYDIEVRLVGFELEQE